MQLQSESNPALNTVTAYGDDYIEINAIAYRHAVYFGPEGDIHPLSISDSQQFTPALLKQIAGLDDVAATDPLAFLDDAPPTVPPNAPQVVVIGTGAQHRFLPADVTIVLHRLGIGVETMSTQAAARTYNILMSEGRRVIAALLPLES